MCWVDLCKNLIKNVPSVDAVQYFYQDQPTISSILKVRYDIFKALETINFLNLTVHRPMDRIQTSGDVSYQTVLNSKVNLDSFHHFASANVLPFTAKECAFGNHIKSLPSLTPAAPGVDFIANTSCDVFNFYFDDVGYIDGIGIMNFPYLQAMVAKTKECNSTLPRTYVGYTENEV